jgi:site-specific recombinase XerD
MTLRTAARRFLRQMEADGKSPLTIRVYHSELDRFFAWVGPRADVHRIRPEIIARYLTSPASLVSTDGTKRSTRTVNRTRTVIRLLFAYLADTGAIRRSPARVLKNAKTDPPVPVPLTNDEIKRFLHALDVIAEESDAGRRDRVLFTLLLRSGMRLSAGLALDVDHLDLTSGTATTNGKAARVQKVFLPPDLIHLLRRHLKTTGVTSGAVFRTSRGRLSARQAQYRFHAIADLAGITRPVTVHSLRHTFATRLRERTGDLRIVQAALGHRRLATTEVYAHVGEEEVRRAVG